MRAPTGQAASAGSGSGRPFVPTPVLDLDVGPSPRSGPRPSDRIALLSLAGLILFTIVAVSGFGLFALHPERLPASGPVLAFYGTSFTLFARLHIVLTALVLGAVLVSRTGWQWLAALPAVYAASFLAEFVGTGTGIPFGGYEYTSLLGPKLGGRVPAVIPLSWFVMAVPSFALAARAFPGSARPWRLLLGAALLTAWDLALDPAMSFLTPYWRWESAGPYYGMPWVNLAGWMLTGLVLMGILEAFGASSWTARISGGWMLAFYATVLLMPLGMLAAAGLWAAVGATILALALLALPLLRSSAPGRGGPPTGDGS